MDNDSVDDVLRRTLRRELQTRAPRHWDDAAAPAFRFRAHQAPSNETGKPQTMPRMPGHGWWWWVAVGTGFAAVLAAGLDNVMTGSGHHGRGMAARSLPVRVVTQVVPTMPSPYNATTLAANYAVSAHAPWTITETVLSTGRVVHRYAVPSDARPQILYATPAGLSILVTHPGPMELFVRTIGPATPVTVWRRPPSSAPPEAIQAWGRHTLWWAVNAGPTGGEVAAGAFNTQSLESLSVPREGLQGTWYTDLNHGVVYRIQGSSLAQWNGRQWVSRGQAPAGRIVAIGTHGWYLADQPSSNGMVTVKWANVESHRQAAMRIAGNLEVGGADWALVLHGSTLVLVLPSRHEQKVVAHGVVAPLIANNAVYWVTSSGHAQRAFVSTSAIGAVDNVQW